MATVDSQNTIELVEPIDERPLMRRRPLDDAEMDITPMIDITFLLLIFFLVASRMDQDTQVELPPARNGAAVSVKNSVILTVANGEGGQAAVYLGDGTGVDTLVSGADFSEQDDQITQFVEEGMSGPSAKEFVLIKAEKGVKHREVARVAKAVGRAADVQLYVAVLEVN